MGSHAAAMQKSPKESSIQQENHSWRKKEKSATERKSPSVSKGDAKKNVQKPKPFIQYIYTAPIYSFRENINISMDHHTQYSNQTIGRRVAVA
jgi:hypothetical protein